MARRTPRDDRAVSVAVTHVMTIGITTLLISGLLLGAGSMLEQQTERAGEQELRAIGDRTATEIAVAADRGERTGANVTVQSRQPGTAVGGSYSVQLTDESTCNVRDGYDGCLVLTAGGADLVVEVPVGVPDGVTIVNGSAPSGSVVVEYDADAAEVTIHGGDGS